MGEDSITDRLAEVARALGSEPGTLHTIEEFVQIARDWTGGTTSVSVTDRQTS